VLNVVYDPKVDEVLGWNGVLFIANLFFIGFFFIMSRVPPNAWQWLKQCSKEKKTDVVTQADFLAYGAYMVFMIIVAFVFVAFILGYINAWAKMRRRDITGIVVDHLTVMNIISIVAIFIGLYDIWLHPYIMQAGENNGWLKMGYGWVDAVGEALSGAWKSVRR
jgi:magnesium-transporting ATPase (P-type)